MRASIREALPTTLGGPGSPHHLQGEMLKHMTGIEMTHPLKGSVPALTDVIAGHVPLMYSDAVPVC